MKKKLRIFAKHLDVGDTFINQKGIASIVKEVNIYDLTIKGVQIISFRTNTWERMEDVPRTKCFVEIYGLNQKVPFVKEYHGTAD